MPNPIDPKIISPTRREVLIGTVVMAAASIAAPIFAAESKPESVERRSAPQGAPEMNTLTLSDGTQIFYKDWGSGQPIMSSRLAVERG